MEEARAAGIRGSDAGLNAQLWLSECPPVRLLGLLFIREEGTLEVSNKKDIFCLIDGQANRHLSTQCLRLCKDASTSLYQHILRLTLNASPATSYDYVLGTVIPRYTLTRLLKSTNKARYQRFSMAIPSAVKVRPDPVNVFPG